MAKLSAYGRHELFRLKKQTEERVDSAFTDYTNYRAFMSDGKILAKETARWKDRGDLHTWNWRIKARVKKEALATKTIEQIAEEYKQSMLAKGWVLV